MKRRSLTPHDRAWQRIALGVLALAALLLWLLEQPMSGFVRDFWVIVIALMQP